MAGNSLPMETQCSAKDSILANRRRRVKDVCHLNRSVEGRMEFCSSSCLVSFFVTALAAASIMSSVTSVAPLAMQPSPTPETRG